MDRSIMAAMGYDYIDYILLLVFKIKGEINYEYEHF